MKMEFREPRAEFIKIMTKGILLTSGGGTGTEYCSDEGDDAIDIEGYCRVMSGNQQTSIDKNFVCSQISSDTSSSSINV